VIRLAHDEESEVVPHGCPNRSMKSSAGTFSSSRVPPSPSGFSSSQSRGMAGREAAWPWASPSHREVRVAIIVQGDDLLAALREHRASVPPRWSCRSRLFPPIAIFIGLTPEAYRIGGLVAWVSLEDL